jgi:hypothetical protein
MLRPPHLGSLALALTTVTLVLTGAPDSLAQSAPPSSRPSGPASVRPSNQLEKRAAEVARAMTKYRATLEPVLAFYERELERQTELAGARQDLYERGALSAREVQEGRRALAAAQKDVDDTRRSIVEADRMTIEARMAAGDLPPLKRGGYEETAGLIRFNGPANWSLAQDTPKLQQFFTARFGRALPVSAFGQTSLHDRMGFDHRNALDVGLHPDGPEGRALMAFLRASGIPFIAAWGAIPGSTSGAHIHVGQPSARLTARR